MKVLRQGCVLYAFSACWLTATPTLASPLFELVGGGQGMGGANARATGASAASTYFNPALLPYAQTGFEVGFYFMADQISISLDPRSGAPECALVAGFAACDVPEVNGAGPESFRHADNTTIDEPTLPTAWLNEGRLDGDGEQVLAPRRRQQDGTGDNQRLYVLLGLVNHVVEDYLALGLHLMIPVDKFTGARSFYNDEREQYFSNSLHPELYSDRLIATSIAFGVGSRVTDQLSLGLSFSLKLKNTAQAPVYVFNLADLDTLLLDSDVAVESSVAPHLAVAYNPLDEVRISVTAHSPQSFDIETGFTYLIATGIEQPAGVNFTHDWLPWTFGLGADLALGSLAGHEFSVVGTGTYALWSNYKDRHSYNPGSRDDNMGYPEEADMVWSDTFGGSLGVRHVHHGTRSFLDVLYQPSPVPDQVGRSNYVDNERMGANLGFDYGFELGSLQLRAGLQGQAHMLLARSVTKDTSRVRDEVPDDAIGGIPRGPIGGDEGLGRLGLQTNNPGFPGFSSEGWVFGGGINLGVEY